MAEREQSTPRLNKIQFEIWQAPDEGQVRSGWNVIKPQRWTIYKSCKFNGYVSMLFFFPLWYFCETITDYSHLNIYWSIHSLIWNKRRRKTFVILQVKPLLWRQMSTCTKAISVLSYLRMQNIFSKRTNKKKMELEKWRKKWGKEKAI